MHCEDNILIILTILAIRSSVR